MKKLLLLLTLTYCISGLAQWTNHQWNHNGISRQYRQYIPSSYDGTTAVPVVFCLHGLGDNMNNFSGIGMNYVADTANFIVITPQAMIDPLANATAWNSGASYMGYTLNSSVNDVGFISTILDTLIANYNVDQTKVYSCGFSMGGFMTNRLGCELNNRIAAIASVAGTIGGAVNCSPGRAVPACHFHGTADSTVYYEGNLYGNDAEELVQFWATNNNCNATAIVDTLPDIAADNFIVIHSLYSTCTDGAEVELFRVDSADHDWLTPANDIFYTVEIWKFFMKHTHSNNVSVQELEPLQFKGYPNPTNDTYNMSIENWKEGMSVELYNVVGDLMFALKAKNEFLRLDLSDYPNGTYFVKLTDPNGLSTTDKLILQH
ncbi:MAG: T9SS type A sorting domain-containing protein [Flavobacteriales bacterium]|nr:T9SS type A sorting domain-containing protein [Flavobacteriales bacterium]